MTSGSEDALAAYQADIDHYPAVLAELTRLTADKPPQIEHWRAVGADLDHLRQDQLEANIDLGRRAQAGQASPDELDQLQSAALARGTFDRAHADLAAAIDYERQLLRERADTENAASDAVRQILTWGTLLAVLLTVGMAWLIASDIARGIERLAHSAQLIAAGDLRHRVALHRTDEIGHTAAAFDQMAASLERDVAALERSEARYKELVSRADDIIYRADAQGCFTFINPVVKHIMGYEPEELMVDTTSKSSTPRIASRCGVSMPSRSCAVQPTPTVSSAPCTRTAPRSGSARTSSSSAPMRAARFPVHRARHHRPQACRAGPGVAAAPHRDDPQHHR